MRLLPRVGAFPGKESEISRAKERWFPNHRPTRPRAAAIPPPQEIGRYPRAPAKTGSAFATLPFAGAGTGVFRPLGASTITRAPL